MAGWFNVATEEELSSCKAKLVDVDNVMIAVFNLNGKYYAIEDVCTHDGAPMLGCGLEPDKVIDDAQIICPRHGARFCVKTGEALTPPAYEPTPTFPVRVENGIIQVTDPRWD
jgi:3-phenylpropionate/trans-cinnamate dioxygenase ferredoxin subunit